ncbi:MAG: cytochrome c, partial [Rubripirellula sp.]|nr:cytochrome c [Rubripirellula sp.]
MLKSIECFKNAEGLGLSNRLLSLIVLACFLPSVIGASRTAIAQAVAEAEPTTDPNETSVKSRQPFVIGFERFGRHGDLTELDSGSLLLSEMGCVSCHASKDVAVQPAGAPDLSDAGHRLQSGWVNDFLFNPHGHSPGTRMPDPFWMLEVKERRTTVEAISAFLASQQQAVSLPRANGVAPVLHEFWEKGNPEVGRDLYHAVGCVACHSPDPEFESSTPPDSAMEQLLEQLEPEEIEELGLTRQMRAVPSMPAFVPGQSNDGDSNDLAEKYTLQSLTLFLLDPHRVRPSARMPDLRLTPSEAADLAAYLIQGDASVSAIADQSDEQLRFLEEQVKKGAFAFANYGCVRCHQANGVDDQITGRPDSTSVPTLNSIATEAPKPLAKLSLDTAASCIESPAAGMPAYLLDAEQKRVVRAAIKQLQLGAKDNSDGVARNVNDVSHRVWEQMVRYNCVACHERQFVEDGPVLGGIGRYRKPFFETTAKVDIGDEGRLPPSLSGVGAKLSSSGLKSVFGVKSIPHRPFMTIRMPSYHDAIVARLLEDLPRADHQDSRDADDVFVASSQLSKKELESVGRELINTGCVECHVFREEQLP